MNNRDRGRIAALDRRRKHLTERLEFWDPQRDPSRTRQELSALEWALDVIALADEDGLLEGLSAELAVRRRNRAGSS